jgi:hypothetical protein
MVTRRKESSLSLQIRKTDRVSGSPRRTKTTLGEKLLRGQNRLRIGLLIGRVTAFLRKR